MLAAAVIATDWVKGLVGFAYFVHLHKGLLTLRSIAQWSVAVKNLKRHIAAESKWVSCRAAIAHESAFSSSIWAKYNPFKVHEDPALLPGGIL